MVESLIITLREGIEAALIVGIILAYLNKTGRTALKRVVYLGLGAGVLASIIFAVVIRAIGLDPEKTEGWLLLAAGIMVASLVVWMWRTAKHVKTEMETKLAKITGDSTSTTQNWGILAFTFVMVFREGAETVLFLTGATLGGFTLLSSIGGAIGIGLAVLFAVFFVRGSLKINLSRFFTVTSIVLLILATKLVLSGIHEFGERGVLPLTAQIMAVIGFFVRDQTSVVIMMALLAAPLLVILWDARSQSASPVSAQESTVERRKRRASRQRERTWRLGLGIAGAFILVAMGTTVARGAGYVDLKPKPVTAADGQVVVPLDSLTEGKLAKYVYQSNGTDVRFLAVKLADGSVAASLDVCKICGARGYGQLDKNAICKRCNAPIPIDTIGQGGGCNPLPLEFSLGGGSLSVPVSALAAAESKFVK